MTIQFILTVRDSAMGSSRDIMKVWSAKQGFVEQVLAAEKHALPSNWPTPEERQMLADLPDESPTDGFNDMNFDQDFEAGCFLADTAFCDTFSARENEGGESEAGAAYDGQFCDNVDRMRFSSPFSD